MQAKTYWGLLIIFAVAAVGWVSRPMTIQAQAAIDLALEQRVDANSASSGDRLTFSLILTNTGTQALTGLLVNDVTPAGTTFFGASAPRGWLMTTPPQNGSGEVAWHSTEPLQPNSRVELQLIVTVQSDRSIVSAGFSATADQLSQPLTSPSITIAVGPQASEAVANPSIGWLAIIVVLFVLMIGVWRWKAIRN
jgi:uncharacterized repeat protein (TIGR01451 family)